MVTYFFECNANYNYIFYHKEQLLFYAISTLGLHLTHERIDVLGYSGADLDIELGLGIGGGVEYKFESVMLFAEPRNFLSGFDQFALSAGVRIPF